MLTNWYRTMVLAAAAALLAGCAANPISVAKSAVEHAVEDRTSADATTDLAIKASIAAEVIDKMGSDVIAISSDVYEGRVMLTGIVETSSQKAQAGALAGKIEDVKTVYNELRVTPATKKEKGTVEGFVDDTVVETKIDDTQMPAMAA